MLDLPEHRSLPNWEKVSNWVEAKRLTGILRQTHATGSGVLINGTFDILHPGHLYALQWARYQGAFLMVTIDDDETAKARGKVVAMPWADRAALIAAIPCVSLVTSHGDSPGTPAWSSDPHTGDRTLAALLRYLRPDVWAARSEDVPAEEIAAALGINARIVRIPRVREQWASSYIRARIIETTEQTNNLTPTTT